MNEHDANRALLDAANVVDPMEQTQAMPILDRRYRQHEARQQRMAYLSDFTPYARLWADLQKLREANDRADLDYARRKAAFQRGQ